MSVKQEFIEFLKKYGISQSKAAEGMGYSAGVVSTWLGDTYKGDLEAVETTARQWMDREESRRAKKSIPITPTETFNRVTRAVTMAHQNKDIALVVGEAGVGKSTALQAYVEANPHNAVIIKVDKIMTKQTLVQDLAEALGYEPKGSVPALAAKVYRTLADRDMVVIIDEADYLKDDALELLRQIVTDKGQSGLVLCGLPRLEFRIKTLTNDHQQIASRVGIFASLGGLRPVDAQTILGGVWPGVEKDKEALDAFWKACSGSLRRLSKLIESAHRTCVVNNLDKPNADVVSAASNLLLKF